MDFLDRRFGGPPDATVVSARPDPPALGDAHAAHFHAAHFYESDESLVRTVGEFLLAGIAAEAPLIMVATAEHLDQVSRYLEAAGVDVEAAHRADRLVRINAGELLDLFMVESLPDAGLFNAIVGGILDTAVQAGKGRAAPRAYGEMVDVLWRAGNPAGAIALEQLWERLLTEVPCHLLCAYSLEGFQGEADGASFDQVCRLHGQIVPAAGRDEAALVRKVQRLERQARLFEQELVRRRELEEALRHALARSRRAEEELTNLVEHSVEGLYWVGPGGAILWANQAQLDLLGYARDEYVGRDVRDFHADAAERDTLERLERLARGDTVPDFEARLRCKDGLIRHVLIHSSALVEDGRFIHTRCFTRDITDRKIA